MRPAAPFFATKLPPLDGGGVKLYNFSMFTTRKEYVLALDQGTTSTRAVVFDENGRIFASAQREFAQIYPRPGYVEHSPADIYASAVKVIEEALESAELSASDIAAIGIANQRETTIVWNAETGEPVYNAIVWQCRRTADFCEELKKAGYSDKIYEKTGLIPDAYFSATKIKWILDNVSGARAAAERGRLRFGTVDTYLLWKLSGGKIYATDYTNAARTMLFNIDRLEWDDELLKLFGVPRSMLPEVLPSGAEYGKVRIYSHDLPVCGVVGDQQAALFGQRCFKAGEVKNTYGTGCFLLMNTGERRVKSGNGLVTTLGAGRGGRPPYVLEGSVFVGGAVVQWLRDGLKIINSAEESEREAVAAGDSGGVYVVPAFTGLGAPWWDADARGTVTGITRGTTRGQIIRASLESVAYEVNDVLEAMQRDAGVRISRLAVDGGASRNDFLMQFQSDVADVSLFRPAVSETTALGAAYLAGLTCGFWKDEGELARHSEGGKTFRPAMPEKKREELLNGWRLAVRRARLK